ncbi:hypothetical protein ZIOFF_060905 [Zingiber officinale]|uniref:Uncharacterized protein n=1 Tax=Zingiber officinale TaxID=94328 RepID=A0A8J5KHZ9_ZINOF|nr:hypothetical protein ZIOFF_060905 [Zingiber officinale]
MSGSRPSLVMSPSSTCQPEGISIETTGGHPRPPFDDLIQRLCALAMPNCRMMLKYHSKVHLKNFKALQQQNQVLEKELQKLKKAIQALTILQADNRPLTQQGVRALIIEISQQSKLAEEKTLKLSANLDKKLHREAIGAVESLEPPALGFIRPSDYSNTIANGTAKNKQNNLQLQLLMQIAKDIQEIRDDLKSILDYQRREGGTPILPDDLIKKLSNLSLGPGERPKEPKGRLLVFKDPLKILR